MKLRHLKQILVINFISLLICLSCINTKDGKFGVSYSLNDAIDRGVFIEKTTSNLRVNDSLFIEHIWIESKWRYKANMNNSDTVSGSQLVIEFQNPEMLRNYLLSWKIVNKSKPLEGLGKVGEKACFMRIEDDYSNTFYVVKDKKIIHDLEELRERKLFEFSIE